MDINLSVGFISYSISFGVYLVMLALFLIGQRDSPKGKPFVVLIFMSVVWSGLLVFSQIGPSIAFELIVIADLLRSSIWIFVLQYAMGSYLSAERIFNYKNLLSPINLFFILVVSCFLLIFNHNIINTLHFSNSNFIETVLQFIYPVIGLVIVEQLFRNTPKEERWNIQILCLSAGSIFVYDIFVYSHALLWNELNYDYWSARGIINVLVLPILIMSAVRNPTLAPRIYISRHAVFHSTTLMVAGAYLVFISIISYLLKMFGGDWGGLLQSTFIFAGLIILALAVTSTSIKLHVKNYLYSNFFSNKYDYRDEWHRFSNTLLTSSDSSIQERALLSVCQIMDSRGGALWLKDEEHFSFSASWNMVLTNEQKNVADEFVYKILPNKKDVYLCNLEHKKTHFDGELDAWFALPLWNQEVLLGFALFQTPIVKRELDNEDKELLKTVSDHIALFFSQHQASFQLMEAQKFQHISQMTAFLVHDLKTVLSQLVLMVDNAKVHKSNPEFIDDMLKTIEHVSKKMQRLISQLKDPEQKEAEESFEMISEIKMLVKVYDNNSINIVINEDIECLYLNLNKESFLSAIKHILQNAVDASEKKSIVTITIKEELDRIVLIISDQGVGMSEKFVNERLFRPFDSSKGVSGMGVGVFQSRQYFRSILGNISVKSEEGVGSEFKIEFPKESEK